MAAWWRKRSLGEQLSILGLVVTAIGSIVVPVYLNAKESRPAPAPVTTAPVATMQATPTTLSDPLSFAIEDNPARISTFRDFGEDFIIPKGTTIIGGPGQGCERFHPWGVRLGGVPAQFTYLRLVIQGRESQAVLVAGMRARVVERRAPLAGTHLVCPSAGEAQIRSIEIDLDEASPEGQYKTPSGTRPFGFTIAKNETEVFDIQAFTKKCYCKWFLELDLIVNGSPRVQTIGNSGMPFETTAVAARQWYEWDYANTWNLTDSSGSIYEPQPRDRPLSPLP
jgi:hypothetical protein